MNNQTPASRATAKRNLLAAAISIAIERHLICEQRTTFEFQLAGLPVLACVRGDADEIVIWTIVEPTELARRFACTLISHRRALFGAAVAVGWLDKQSGKFLQVSGDYHASNWVTPLLARLTLTKAAPRRIARARSWAS